MTVIRKPTQGRGRAKYEMILTTAKRLIGEHGNDSVSMREIAKQAGISVASIYQYFPEFLEHINDTFANLRNDILHGKKLDYPDKNLSTKLVITLYQLHCSINGYS